jgi:hypothetical protein
VRIAPGDLHHVRRQALTFGAQPRFLLAGGEPVARDHFRHGPAHAEPRHHPPERRVVIPDMGASATGDAISNGPIDSTRRKGAGVDGLVIQLPIS